MSDAVRTMLRNARAMRTVMANLRRSEAELDRRRHEQLRRLLVVAGDHVPFYRQVMGELGYDPRRDYGGPADLDAFPITSRQLLKSRPLSDFVRDDVRLDRMFTDRTSGSTGQPMRVWRDPEARAFQVARWLRVLRVNGWRATDHVVSFTSPQRLAEGRTLLQAVGLMRRTPVAYTLEPQALVDAVLRLRPAVLYGNRSSFQQLVAAVAARGRPLQGVRLAVVTGEVVTRRMRADCEEWLGVRPTESYGSVEVGVMAYETPHRPGMHLCDDLMRFEFRSDDGGALPPGRPGRVLVTSLYGTVMPFIRYDHGDRVTVADLPDGQGRPSRRIMQVMGRDNDVVVLPGGRVVTFLAIYEVMGQFQDLWQFRVVQDHPTRFRVLLAGDEWAVARAAPLVRDGMSGLLGRDVTVAVERVDRMPVDPGGKIRVVESRAGAAR